VKMISVQSSMLKAIGYDAERGELAIEYHSGLRSHHGGVPPAVYIGLMNTESHGKYYNEHIKGRYPGHRAGVTPEIIPDRSTPLADSEPAPVKMMPARSLDEAIKRFMG